MQGIRCMTRFGNTITSFVPTSTVDRRSDRSLLVLSVSIVLCTRHSCGTRRQSLVGLLSSMPEYRELYRLDSIRSTWKAPTGGGVAAFAVGSGMVPASGSLPVYPFHNSCLRTSARMVCMCVCVCRTNALYLGYTHDGVGRRRRR